MNDVAGKRILVVEDEYLVASLIEDMLAGLGVVVVGPVYGMAHAISLAREAALDAAVLDVNLNNQRSDPIADVLKGRQIPFILATGYGNAEEGAGVPVVQKPFTEEKLADALRSVLAAHAT